MSSHSSRAFLRRDLLGTIPAQSIGLPPPSGAQVNAIATPESSTEPKGLDGASANTASPGEKLRVTGNSPRTGNSQRTGCIRRSARLHKQSRRILGSEYIRAPASEKQTHTHSPRQPAVEHRIQQQVTEERQRKRPFASDSGGNTENQPKRTKLTKKNLELLNKMGRKKGVLPPTSASMAGTSTTKTTSTTSSGFAMQAQKNGILDYFKSQPPANIKDIRGQHTRSRATASPPESQYGDFVDGVTHAPNEASMLFEMGRLLKSYHGEGYQRAINQGFTNFPRDVGFNNGLSAPQPDFVEGIRAEEFDSFPIDERVSGAVLFKDDPYSVTLPHIAGEWKGRGKDMEEARMQSAYDGAALVYARNQALASIGESDPPCHAHVTTFTTDGTNLNFFAHYAAPSDDGVLKYHQHQFASTNIKDSYQGHKDGRRGLRNRQDYAKEQAKLLKTQLTEHWRIQRAAAGGSDLNGGLGNIPEEDWPVPEQEEEDDCVVIDRAIDATTPARPSRTSGRKQLEKAALAASESKRSRSSSTHPTSRTTRNGKSTSRKRALAKER